MSRWFRYYEEALNDPKVQRLSGDMFKAWVNLLCLASKSGGEIVSISDAAFALRLSESKAAAVVADLAGRELLDRVDGRYFAPHNWRSRQYKSDVSNDRVKQHRERKRNAKCNVTRNEPETPPETEQIQNERETRAREPLISPEAFDLSDAFLKAIGADREAPEWQGIPYTTQAWLSAGISQDFILSKAASIAAGQQSIPHRNYFDKAIRRSWADEQAAPRPAPTANRPNTNGKTVQDVARELEQQFRNDDGLDIPPFLKREPLRAIAGG